MDLQTIGAREAGGWSWARTGALILFVVTGILLIVSLQAEDSRQHPAAYASELGSSAGKAG